MAIDIRKLAAFDIVFHGTRLILAEFAAGILLPLSLGLLSLFRARALWQTVIGVYLILLALNYVPLTAYAIAIALKGSARVEVADVLAAKNGIASKYMRQSLFLLLPFVVPCLALAQELRKRK